MGTETHHSSVSKKKRIGRFQGYSGFTLHPLRPPFSNRESNAVGEALLCARHLRTYSIFRAEGDLFTVHFNPAMERSDSDNRPLQFPGCTWLFDFGVAGQEKCQRVHVHTRNNTVKVLGLRATTVPLLAGVSFASPHLCVAALLASFVVREKAA